MKKIYFLLCAIAISYSSSAQTIDNPGFESWRSSVAGSIISGCSTPLIPVHAPSQWYSFDSLVIGGLMQFGVILLGVTPCELHAQLFKENDPSHVNSGTYSAKLVSVKQDTVGILPGSLANAQPGVNASAIGGGGGSGIGSAITYSGGTGTNLRITSVSAYIQYYPGKDSVTGIFGGNDSGLITVQATSTIAGIATVVGSGRLVVGSTPTFTEMTVNLDYTDTVNFVDTVRIIFASGRGMNDLDSSTMYVDDVRMAGTAQIPNNVTLQNVKNDLVKVYPNPATGIIHLDGPQNAGLTCDLVSVSGQVAATKKLTGSDIVDIAELPSGLYFYIISDAQGNKVQRGKVTVNR